MTRKKKEVFEEVVETELIEETAEATQKKYVVIHDFKDLKDNNIIYIKGDIYPKREDAIVDEARVKELMSIENKIGKAVIKEQD